MSRRMPGLTWRILAHHRSTEGRDSRALNLAFTPTQNIEFDELVLGPNAELHIEQMGPRDWNILVNAGPDDERWNGNLRIPAKGPAELTWCEWPGDELPEDEHRYRAALQHLVAFGADDEPKARAFARSVLGPATTDAQSPAGGMPYIDSPARTAEPRHTDAQEGTTP